jgi:hypothetical protein
MHVHVHTYASMCMHVHVHEHIFSSMCMHIHTYIHIYRYVDFCNNSTCLALSTWLLPKCLLIKLLIELSTGHEPI